MNSKNKVDREEILNSLKLMRYYLDRIFELQSQIQYEIGELESKEINFKEDASLQKIKLRLSESNTKLEKYRNIKKEIRFEFLSPWHSQKKIVVSILKKHNYNQKKIIQTNKQWIGNLLTCYHRLSRLSNAPEHIEKSSREIKNKIAQEFILYNRQIHEENTRIRKAEKAVLFMSIIGEIEKEAHQDYLSSIIKLKELSERIEQIFITQNSNIFVVKNPEKNLTLVR